MGRGGHISLQKPLLTIKAKATDGLEHGRQAQGQGQGQGQEGGVGAREMGMAVL